MSGNGNTKEGLIVFPSRQHNAFQISGDSRAAQHCRGLDDIPLPERCNISKADVPLIFVTANGEVPCDEVIATEILQLGITRDIYVKKDPPSVISIGRLVLDDGYDFVWKHRDRQAILVSSEGKRHKLWTDNSIPMLPAQLPNLQPGTDSILPSPAPGEAPHEDIAMQTSPTITSKHFRPSWYCGPKRYMDEWQRVLTTSAPT